MTMDPELTMKNLCSKIQTADNILVCSHQKPDGDTLGSGTAFINWLLREGKEVAAFCTSPIPHDFRFLDNIQRFTSDPAVFAAAYDLVIVVDSGDLAYCGIEEHVNGMSTRPFIANIDHHPTNTNFGDLNLVIPSASSTAEVVARFFATNNIAVDDRMATSILTGLMTDTGNFINSATSAAALTAAGNMMECGGRLRDIHNAVNRRHTIPSLRLWGRALERLHVDPDRDLAVTYILRRDLEGMPEDAASGISNFLHANLADHDAVLVLVEEADGTVRGSLRSTERDILPLAQRMGGGGHAKAAGFTVRGRIEETATGPKIVN